jgi:pimeloyl-ACP methyl ester carboxylesterase
MPKTRGNISIVKKLLWKRFKERNRGFVARITSQLNKKPNNLLTKLRSIKIPIYLIYGTRDSIIPQETFALLENYLPERSIVEKYPLDHGISHEHPQLLNSLLLGFCSKILSSN